MVRAYTYFIAWIIAYNVSGAHFNPATSFAVYITEQKWKSWGTLLIRLLAQLLGSFTGLFIEFLLVKNYYQYKLIPSLTNSIIYIDGDNVNWGRIIGQEVL